MNAARLNMAEFIKEVRGWFESGDKPDQIHLRHADTGGTIKRFRGHDFENRSPDEICARIVERAQSDAKAWKQPSTYLVDLMIGKGAQHPEETYAFSVDGRAPTQKRGAAAGGVISGDRDEVVAELVRMNGELHNQIHRMSTLVTDWSETRATEDRAEIGSLRSERAAVWSTIDQLRSIDREAQRADKEWERDKEMMEEGKKLFSMLAAPVLNRIVGFKLLPEQDSPLLEEFRSMFEELRKDVPTFDKLMEAVQGNETVSARIVTMFDKFLTDKEKKEATAMLVARATKQLAPKTETAAAAE